MPFFKYHTIFGIKQDGSLGIFNDFIGFETLEDQEANLHSQLEENHKKLNLAEVINEAIIPLVNDFSGHGIYSIKFVAIAPDGTYAIHEHKVKTSAPRFDRPFQQSFVLNVVKLDVAKGKELHILDVYRIGDAV
jgi:hypothetical protein